MKRAASRSAFTITSFAHPGCAATPRISTTAASAEKVSSSTSPRASLSNV
jgi:hypothetical protein